MLNLGLEGWFFLVGVDTSYLCFTGGVWSTGRAHEGRHQAQPHADTGGEQSGQPFGISFLHPHFLGESRLSYLLVSPHSSSRLQLGHCSH